MTPQELSINYKSFIKTIFNNILSCSDVSKKFVWKIKSILKLCIHRPCRDLLDDAQWATNEGGREYNFWSISSHNSAYFLMSKNPIPSFYLKSFCALKYYDYKSYKFSVSILVFSCVKHEVCFILLNVLSSFV